jgi:hypothetical protein
MKGLSGLSCNPLFDNLFIYKTEVIIFQQTVLEIINKHASDHPTSYPQNPLNCYDLFWFHNPSYPQNHRSTSLSLEKDRGNQVSSPLLFPLH